jgi:hypothetical protein
MAEGETMTVWRHVALWLIGSLTWALFTILGLPWDTFTAWNLDQLILLNLVAAFAVVPLIGAMTLLLLGGDTVLTALWAAFYHSVPLLIYDLVLHRYIGGKGLGFLVSHWTITIRYLYVWIELPLIGLALDGFKWEVLRATEDRRA